MMSSSLQGSQLAMHGAMSSSLQSSQAMQGGIQQSVGGGGPSALSVGGGGPSASAAHFLGDLYPASSPPLDPDLDLESPSKVTKRLQFSLPPIFKEIQPITLSSGDFVISQAARLQPQPSPSHPEIRDDTEAIDPENLVPELQASPRTGPRHAESQPLPSPPLSPSHHLLRKQQKCSSSDSQVGGLGGIDYNSGGDEAPSNISLRRIDLLRSGGTEHGGGSTRSSLMEGDRPSRVSISGRRHRSAVMPEEAGLASLGWLPAAHASMPRASRRAVMERGEPSDLMGAGSFADLAGDDLGTNDGDGGPEEGHVSPPGRTTASRPRARRKSSMMLLGPSSGGGIVGLGSSELVHAGGGSNGGGATQVGLTMRGNSRGGDRQGLPACLESSGS